MSAARDVPGAEGAEAEAEADVRADGDGAKGPTGVAFRRGERWS